MSRKPRAMHVADNGPLLNDFNAASSVVTSTFRLMSIAEEELKGRDKPGLFMLLAPTTPMFGKDERVYRHHCRELITRFNANQNTQLATKAEVLVALSELSQQAPPDQQYAALMDLLFTEVMGVPIEGPNIPEPWKGASDELLGRMRNKLAVEGRKVSL